MLELFAITPFERPDAALVQAVLRTQPGESGARCTPVLDLGRDVRAARRALSLLEGDAFGVRIPEGVSPPTLPATVHTVIVGPEVPPSAYAGRRVLVEVRTIEEAHAAAAAGAAGVIGKGSECGGRVGPEGAFVLAQHLATAGLPIPWWIQGGLGLHTLAAVAAAGAAGGVLDAQLALLPEATTPEAIRKAVRAMDGSETTVVGGHRVYTRPDLAVARTPELSAEATRARLGGDDLQRQLVPMGQDAALAAPLVARFPTAAALLAGLLAAVPEHLESARRLDPLGAGSPLAVDHGTRWPIAQGPMTRVSDRAPFARAVAEGGGLPFIALSMLDGRASRALLQETAEACAGLPWGVGILGFVPPELRDPQLAAIAEIKPPFALIAGGRPSQARALEQAGTPTWLHVPSPALLDAFLADGARRFVFEGSECGGHIGPRTSFVLWEQQLTRLLASPHVAATSVLLAGGVHDGLSAAMVAALAGTYAAAGGKVGVLMGTAYLFTQEAVATGAILPGFQRAALDTDTTVLLETAPGHATRCAPTPFVEAFEAERRRLSAEGQDAKAVWAALEQLNVGRLRLASKGIVREGGALVEVDEARQRAEGMVMIGQVAALRRALTTIAALHQEVGLGTVQHLGAPHAAEVHEAPPPADIAIVGMACIFPDALDKDAFWRHVQSGHDAVREVPAERWRADLYHDPHGTPGDTTPSKWGGMLPEVRFDPLRYGIPPRSLGAIDPAQLLALDVARRALEDAGYDRRAFDRERTSVIFGTESGSDLGAAYSFRAHHRQWVGPLSPALDEALPKLTEDSFPGVLANVLAGRIANRLDLGGVNYTVDAACASSLAALDLAVKELTGGTSDLVLCGGADLHNGINDYLLFSSVHALSPTGHCRTFDAQADGIALGEGVACVALKRLSDARRDGDRVYAVLRGVGGSSDGKSLGLTAPRKEGQMRAVTRAWAQAHVDPAEVGMIEAHGTGTIVGDRTELSTLEETFSGVRRSVTLGSVKSQIGHTKCAAGLAGLIKTALALHHGVRPPTFGITRPNPAWRAEASPFHFSSLPRPWPEARRVAGVSAFGFGGTNFHVVMEAADAQPVTPTVRSAELFVLRGAPERVNTTIDQLLAQLSLPEPPPLAVLAKAALGEGPVAVAIVATSLSELKGSLHAARARKAVEGAVWIVQEAAEAGEVAFLFPGQGSQRPQMLRELFVAEPRLQRFLAAAPELVERLYPPDAFDEATRKAQAQALTDTRVAQPALGVTSLAAASWLEGCGVRASMAAGHSYGELAALAWAGALDLPTLVAVSRARAQALLEAAPGDTGTMAAVNAPPDEVRGLLDEHPDVVIANHNAPRQTVIAGPTSAVGEALKRLEAAGVAARPIPVACAFHSPVVASAEPAFRAVLDAVALGPTDVPVWSNTTAAPHPSEPDAVRALLARQLASPVRFVEQIEAMYAAGARTFVEVGGGRVLTGLVEKILAGRPVHALALDVPGEPGWVRLLGALAALATRGVDVREEALVAGRGLAGLDLAAPLPVPGPMWIVDGHRARPEHGAPPPGSLIPILEPLGGPGAGIGLPAPIASDAREAVVLGFLQNMQQVAEAQRDAVLALLGQAPGPRAPVIEAIGRPTQAPARAVAAPAPALPARPAARPVSLQDTLLAVVAERTGYPPEMLAPDLDLEADLSIDSIKRIEILNALGQRLGTDGLTLDDKAIEALATRRTLAAIVSWLEEAGVGVSEAAPTAPAPVDLMALLSGVVAERTGYPPEMLGPDLDLEADLSIDSIKRIEILNALGQRLGEGAPPIDDAAIERLATRRTLRELVDALGAKPAATAAPQLTASVAPSENAVARWRLVARPAPGASPSGLPTRLSVVDDDAGRGAAVVVALRAQGLDAEVHSVEDASTSDIVIALDGAGPVAVFPTLKRLLEGGARTVIGVDGGGAGLDGLFKSAAREYPDRTVRLVSLDNANDVAAIGAALPVELVSGGPSFVSWRQSVREILELEAAPLAGADAPFPLVAGDVVLVTGGARGITARIAEALASQAPLKLVLVGRSPEPAPEPPELAAAPDAAALRKVMLAQGESRPAAIEARVREIEGAREIRATLARLRARGATVDYRALDVRDAAAFGALLDELYTTHGRIDAVVHGAGVLEDKLMRDKTPESFARVFDTKVRSAEVLAAKLRADTKLVVFFASISGVLGNRGQSDYAAANAALAALAERLGDRLTGRVVAIDWGPWGGAGMVGDALARAYEKRGIGLIDVEAGVVAFLDELRRGTRADRRVIWQAGSPEAFGATRGV